MSNRRIQKIVTHPGSAHKDDFLACCVLLHFHPVPIERHEVTSSELDDDSIAVVDVGHRHEPEKLNFDHHQFPKDHDPICALSLVFQHLELYEDARRFCDWLEPAEWFDSRGAADTASWLGVEREVIGQLHSPIDVCLLRRFGRLTRLNASEPLWQIMKMVGDDTVHFLQNLRSRLSFVDQHAEFWSLDSGKGPFEVLYMPRTDPLPGEPAAGLGWYIEEKGKTETVTAMIYPDKRGPGYGLSRFRDSSKLDFSSLETECSDVHFSHARGFVAKTSSLDQKRLRELIVIAREAGTE